MPRLVHVAVALFGLFGAACSVAFPVGDFEGAPGVRDDGGARDGGVRRDAGARDGGRPIDASWDAAVDAGHLDGGVDGSAPDAGFPDSGPVDSGPFCRGDANRIFCSGFDTSSDPSNGWGGGTNSGGYATLVVDNKSTYSPPGAMRADLNVNPSVGIERTTVATQVTDPSTTRVHAFRYRFLTSFPGGLELPIFRVEGFPPFGPAANLVLGDGEIRLDDDATPVLRAATTHDGDWHHVEVRFGSTIVTLVLDGILVASAPWTPPFSLDQTALQLGVIDFVGPWPAISIVFDDFEVRR